jgi:hypothetical protein
MSDVGKETEFNVSTHLCRLPIDAENRQKLQGFLVLSSVASVLSSIPTVFLNALVLVGIYKTPSLHTQSNFLLFGLALSDVGAGLLVMPSTFVLCLVHIHDNLIHFWCGFRWILNYCLPFFSGVSCMTVTAISIDRMIALHFHLRYEAIVTNTRTISSLVVIWITVFLISLLQLWSVELLRWISILILLICLVVCIFNNLKIFKILQRHRARIQQQEQQLSANITHDINMTQRRKTSRNMLWVYGLFVLCYFPIIICGALVNVTSRNVTLTVVYSIAFALVFLNSILNPILYTIKMRGIRRAMCRFLPGMIRKWLGVSVEQNNL